ncbi:hypothetical protein [Stakelama pacifica]|uniref:Uncharacterized protein n=1 Tax=Stakelama pacifica TaxID=517720 RepID=A0A4R6FQY1_9SPHN|nr:hypothetical protein [Stakelama pacifica]TDN83530.1 hypothetical protein EV664_10413 [Stakelama pacifica]GGO94086.1 hypothetical protein GCM10011329_15030 [Stakelama pacifica]
MPVMLPLTLLGVGYLIYQIFAGATLALPIALGVAAGFGASRLGCSPLLAVGIGVLVCLVVIGTSRFAALKLASPYARAALAALFAMPAALARYSVAHALGWFAGSTGIIAGLIGAGLCAVIAAHRLLRPAI